MKASKGGELKLFCKSRATVSIVIPSVDSHIPRDSERSKDLLDTLGFFNSLASAVHNEGKGIRIDGGTFLSALSPRGEHKSPQALHSFWMNIEDTVRLW